MSDDKRTEIRCARCRKKGHVMEFVHYGATTLCPRCFNVMFKVA